MADKSEMISFKAMQHCVAFKSKNYPYVYRGEMMRILNDI